MHSRYTTSWQNTTVDDNGTDLTYTGEYTSIAFNGANGFIAYYDSSNTNLKLARSTNYGVSWGSIQNIDYSEDDGQYTSIAVDTSNNYYVSYYNNTDNELKLSVNNIEQTVYGNGGSAPSSNDVGKYSSIALVNASPNRLYIAYYDTTYGAVNVSHSHDNATSWTHVQVDNGGSNTPGTSNVGEYCSIAAVADRSTDGDDTGDDLYICYYDVTNTNLKFARSNDGGTTWSSRTIDSASVNAGQYARIAVVPASDSYANDRIYVVYYNAVSSTIKVLKSIDGGTSW